MSADKAARYLDICVADNPLLSTQMRRLTHRQREENSFQESIANPSARVAPASIRVRAMKSDGTGSYASLHVLGL